jgi:hypothetical protein
MAFSFIPVRRSDLAKYIQILGEFAQIICAQSVTQGPRYDKHRLKNRALGVVAEESNVLGGRRKGLRTTEASV